MYIFVNQFNKTILKGILARFSRFFPKKSCKSTMLTMDYQICINRFPSLRYQAPNPTHKFISVKSPNALLLSRR